MTITHSIKLLSLVIPISILGGAGFDPQDPQDNDSQEALDQQTDLRVATATIANMLPADGCSYPVSIGRRDFAPDAASAASVSELVPGGGTITARISYRLTGNIGHVECGFGTSRELPEISF